jgi:hypothetical protein
LLPVGFAGDARQFAALARLALDCRVGFASSQ